MVDKSKQGEHRGSWQECREVQNANLGRDAYLAPVPRIGEVHRRLRRGGDFASIFALLLDVGPAAP